MHVTWHALWESGALSEQIPCGRLHVARAVMKPFLYTPVIALAQAVNFCGDIFHVM